MTRPDLSDYLIHFTKDSAESDAIDTFCQIVTDRVLKGGTGMIKGNYPCVCFSEAPLSAIKAGLVNPVKVKQKYAPFGFMVRKDWLFPQGGRPVIYQTEAEFLQLPSSMRWRHVTYDPPRIDFTWEREWRIQCEALLIDPENVTLVFPSRFAEKLIDSKIQTYKLDLSSLPGYVEMTDRAFDPEDLYLEMSYWDEARALEEMFPDFSEWEKFYIE